MHHEKTHICIKPKSVIVIIQEETTAQVIDVRDWTQWDSPEITGIPKCGVDRSVTAEAGIWQVNLPAVWAFGTSTVFTCFELYFCQVLALMVYLCPHHSVLSYSLRFPVLPTWSELPRTPDYTLSPQPRVFLTDRITKSPWITLVSIFLSSLH